jgi:VWFA-related protein
LDLNADTIEILENGLPQKLEIFQEAVQPVSIVLALDASGSMKKSEADVVASARQFIDALRPQDKLGLMLFADRAELAQDLATSRPAMHQVLDTYAANGGTALYDAVVNSLTRLKRVEGRRVVVVMTDGRDENNPGTAPGSVSRLEDVERLVQETGVLVFAIGLGVKVDREPLLKMAAWSGGRALFPADVEELPAEFHRVVDDLRRRYVVGYTSSNIEHDGSWRQVEIRVKDAPEVTVRSTGGYFAPQQ